MYKFIQTLAEYFKPYYFYILTFVVVAFFSITAYYGYNRYIKSKMNDKQLDDVANANNRNTEANVYFFHVEWCPHCVKAKPEWDKFVQDYNNKKINGYIIKTHTMDCTNDIDDEISAVIQKYEIKSYPTVKLIIDGESSIELESKITKKTLEVFVNEILTSK